MFHVTISAGLKCVIVMLLIMFGIASMGLERFTVKIFMQN